MTQPIDCASRRRFVKLSATAIGIAAALVVRPGAGRRWDRRRFEQPACDQEVVRRAIGAGGKVYPPYSPPLPAGGWREHYGASTWRRFAAARRRFDPSNILTPGAGIFG